MATNKDIIPAQPTHLGVFIKDALDVSPDLNQKQLVKQLDVKPAFLNEIIKEKRLITLDLAVSVKAASAFLLNTGFAFNRNMKRI